MSDYTQTPNLSLFKPNFNADVDNWGYHLNANADALDAALATSGGSVRFLPLAGGTMTGMLTLSGAPTANLHAATKLYADGKLALTGGTVTGATSFTGGFTADSTTLAQIGGTNPALLRLRGNAGTTRTLQFTSANLARWNFSATSAAEGNNQGSLLEVDAFTDAGAFSGILLQANRASGTMGLGRPEITSLAPWTQTVPRATYAGGVTGNYQNFVGATNAQPTSTLGANPIATTSGSNVVTVTWTGCAAANGPLSRLQYETWVNLQGATAVGGITPTGWLQVQSTPDANHFTVNWTSTATSTATGGGSSVTVQPSFTTSTNTVSSTEKTGASGFNVQTVELFNIDPLFYLPIGYVGGGGGGRFCQRWHWTCGPNDPTGSNSWVLAGIEWDLTNRGPDMGYHPNAGNAINGTTGMWMGVTSLPAWATGGGTAANWGSVFNVYNTQEQTGVAAYNAFINQPHSLVGAARDPTGHGGVAFDAFGALHNLGASSFTTQAGTSNITVNVPAGFLNTVSIGDQVYIANQYTISGVTFGHQVHTITALPSGGFTFQGTGTAAASIPGGGAANVDWYALEKLVPYAPFQIGGSFKHGLCIGPQTHIESGGIVEAPPGNGILWSDGTGTASINSAAAGTGNIDVVITPAGTGGIKPAGLINAANDAAAAAANVSVGSLYRNGSQLMMRVT